MPDKLTFDDKIGILDPKGELANPLTGNPYSDRYKELAIKWSIFPTYLKSADILKSINENQLTFIISATGSGKSVLVPKLALHYTAYQGKIGMTLPKRVITLSAAMFAAETLDVKLGTDIGYQFKGSPKEMVSSANRIVYMTDGILTMKFTNDPLLSEYNVIIIDEAHERKIQIDLILLFLKNLLQSGKRPDLKVIIMSATIDGPKYQKYFSGIKSNIINIAGLPNYEIKVHYLENPSKSYMTDGYNLIEKLVDQKIKSDMLFFITTSNEAFQLCKKIRPIHPKVYCIEVYADMDKDLKIYAESRAKFLELGAYDQKLVMATNVAESSLTIDGLVYVIDSGYELYSSFNPQIFGEVLEKRLISKAQAMQRRGRVGRTESGVCYHLLTKDQFNHLKPYQDPEILTQDITMDMIKIIQTTPTKSYTDGLKFLNNLMDIPKPIFIDTATKILNFYKIINTDGILTKIGSDITKFSSNPLNRTLFLIYSFQLHCGREASIILAMIDACNGKITNLFYKSDVLCNSNMKNCSESFLKKIADKSGDHITLLNIHSAFKAAGDQRTFAIKHGLRFDALVKADRNFKTYFYKIINLSKAPLLDQSRVEGVSIEKKIRHALKLSHQHLQAKNFTTTYPDIKIKGSISRDSAIYFKHKRSALNSKKFIYDSLTSINGNWEFQLVTIID